MNQVGTNRIKQAIRQSGKEVERIVAKIIKNAIKEIYKTPFRLLGSFGRKKHRQSNSHSNLLEKWQMKNHIMVVITETEMVGENYLIKKQAKNVFCQQTVHIGNQFKRNTSKKETNH